MVKRLSMTDDEAMHVVGYVNQSKRYKFSNHKEWQEALDKRTEYRNKGKEDVLRMSALKSNGDLMDIDEYCNYYGINRLDVKSYKLVTHTSIPYYNIQSSNVLESLEEFDIYEKVDNLIKEYTPTTRLRKEKVNSDIITQLIFSDVHLGMDASDSGQSLYGGQWKKKNITRRLEEMVDTFLLDTPDVVDCVQILNLGDFADGIDGFTTSRSHKLPQNMTNEEVFDLGVEFLTYIAESILQHKKANKIIFYNVCNSNHSASFDYFICQAFKGRFLGTPEIEIINERKFIGHFSYGKHTEIITHGKDSKHMKFGMTPQLNPKMKDKVNDYINFHQLQGYIQLHKGDNHIYSVDKCDTFDYNSYLAFAPSSSWIQHNFNRGRSGFSIIEKSTGQYSGVSKKDYEFKWDSDNLK